MGRVAGGRNTSGVGGESAGGSIISVQSSVAYVVVVGVAVVGAGFADVAHVISIACVAHEHLVRLVRALIAHGRHAARHRAVDPPARRRARVVRDQHPGIAIVVQGVERRSNTRYMSFICFFCSRPPPPLSSSSFLPFSFELSAAASLSRAWSCSDIAAAAAIRVHPSPQGLDGC